MLWHTCTHWLRLYSAAQATVVALVSSKGHLPNLCVFALPFALSGARQLAVQLFCRAARYTYWGLKVTLHKMIRCLSVRFSCCWSQGGHSRWSTVACGGGNIHASR